MIVLKLLVLFNWKSVTFSNLELFGLPSLPLLECILSDILLYNFLYNILLDLEIIEITDGLWRD